MKVFVASLDLHYIKNVFATALNKLQSTTKCKAIYCSTLQYTAKLILITPVRMTASSSEAMRVFGGKQK